MNFHKESVDILMASCSNPVYIEFGAGTKPAVKIVRHLPGIQNGYIRWQRTVDPIFKLKYIHFFLQPHIGCLPPGMNTGVCPASALNLHRFTGYLGNGLFQFSLNGFFRTNLALPSFIACAIILNNKTDIHASPLCINERKSGIAPSKVHTQADTRQATLWASMLFFPCISAAVKAAAKESPAPTVSFIRTGSEGITGRARTGKLLHPVWQKNKAVWKRLRRVKS